MAHERISVSPLATIELKEGFGMQVRERALVALVAAVITVGAVLPAAFAAGGATP